MARIKNYCIAQKSEKPDQQNPYTDMPVKEDVILISDDPESAIKYQQLLYTTRAEILAKGGNLQDFLNSSIYKHCIREISKIQKY